MARLSRYLLRLFFSETLALAALVIALLYLVQCLRIMDVVTVKGQDLITLFQQAALAIPLIAKVFLYICIGIGLVRALSALQQNGELHIIHSSGRLRGLFGAIGMFCAVMCLVVLVLAHYLSPTSMRRYDEWAATIAADLVARALVPHRFAEVVPGVIVSIASREGEGQITGFFSDDRRDPAQRRTYTADSALVASTGEGYVLQLHDGAIQYMTADGRFSEVRFSRYDLAVGRLTDQRGAFGNHDSFSIAAEAIATGNWSYQALFDLADRTGEGLRVIGMCLLITGIAGFPGGRRRGPVPLEIVVLIITFADRGLTTYPPTWMGPYGAATGSLAMIGAGLLLLAWRLWGSRLRLRVPRLRRAPA